MFKRKAITEEERLYALKLALEYWNNGKYSKSQEICKKYGITTDLFAKALVGTIRKGDVK